MLDPALCARSTSQWLSLKGVLSTWFMTPSLVMPLFVEFSQKLSKKVIASVTKGNFTPQALFLAGI
jgi:hypothetical protein